MHQKQFIERDYTDTPHKSDLYEWLKARNYRRFTLRVKAIIVYIVAIMLTLMAIATLPLFISVLTALFVTKI